MQPIIPSSRRQQDFEKLRQRFQGNGVARGDLARAEALGVVAAAVVHPAPERAQFARGVKARNGLIERIHHLALGVSLRAALGVVHDREDLHGVERRLLDGNQVSRRTAEIGIHALLAVLVVFGERFFEVCGFHPQFGGKVGDRLALDDPALLDFLAVVAAPLIVGVPAEPAELAGGRERTALARRVVEDVVAGEAGEVADDAVEEQEIFFVAETVAALAVFGHEAFAGLVDADVAAGNADGNDHRRELRHDHAAQAGQAGCSCARGLRRPVVPCGCRRRCCRGNPGRRSASRGGNSSAFRSRTQSRRSRG